MAKKKQKINGFEHLLAASSYLWVLCVVPFVLGHNNKFVYNHAKQGMALFILWLALSVIGWIPFFGWFVWIAGMIFIGVCGVIGIAHALGGKEWEVPIIGKYASPH